MKGIFFILLSLSFFMKSYGQNNEAIINFIIIVDDQIPSTGNIGLKFITQKESREIDTIVASYVPGDLSIRRSDFDKLLSQDIKSIKLDIKSSEVCKEEVKYHTYEIEIRKAWLEYPFIVFRIYNLDKKRYKKLFVSLDRKDYTFEIDYPGGSMMRIRKKHPKENCK
ncbi:MAG: hypothetical protein J7604_17610 [Sporocytophaga sp.]|uniref:hypothetical protein n=1 Tax=Sporocytophaga sp. TaxID=2231183 RepID=UPI001B0D6409|nr:hypothetical protein [Sporocytophaga sp.]MBO9702029.1 hypothetical protein [Sporocytophaga sp.]